MKTPNLALFLVVANALLRTSSASAVVVYTTLDDLGGYDASSASAINGWASQYGYQAHANEFVAEAGGMLSSIEIGVHYAYFDSSPAEQVDVQLTPDYIDPLYGHLPSSTSLVSGSVSTPSFFGASDLVIFTPSGSVSLVLGEPYWLVITPHYPGTVADWCYSSTGAAGRIAVSFAGNYWLPNPYSAQNAFRVNVTPVPEPSIWLLAFVGLGLLTLRAPCIRVQRQLR